MIDRWGIGVAPIVAPTGCTIIGAAASRADADGRPVYSRLNDHRVVSITHTLGYI